MKIAWIFFFIFILYTSSQDEYENRRKLMVSEQIKARGLRHEATLRAMETVPRHLFVPTSGRSFAYHDNPVPIGHGQTISQPYIVAYMTQIVDPKPDHKVLEIGAGSGYQAAILSQIVKEVYTLEIIPELAEGAKSVLAALQYNNVHVKTADGYYGWEEAGPFDAIVVTAAAEHIPPPLIAQLKEGGKMIIPVGSPFMTQSLMLVEKEKGKIKTRSLMAVRFVPFTRSN
ncbi:MAG: protein-L-isoaspartate(D-aspartate) O-methyltransferase [Cyclobacteriaceae bacterium]|nr:protein-L-isoaspartate(D-aspartate) O-methyltransferase [Cyclobacteriaceae bacterium]